MARPRPEWIGKHHGVNIPPRVRQRIFDRDGGVCHLCKLPIKPGETWQADHVIALINGGEHREANLAPIWRPKHREKTGEENSAGAKADRIGRKHRGTWPKSKTPLRSRGFSKSRPIPETSHD